MLRDPQYVLLWVSYIKINAFLRLIPDIHLLDCFTVLGYGVSRWLIQAYSPLSQLDLNMKDTTSEDAKAYMATRQIPQLFEVCNMT